MGTFFRNTLGNPARYVTEDYNVSDSAECRDAQEEKALRYAAMKTGQYDRYAHGGGKWKKTPEFRMHYRDKLRELDIKYPCP